MSVSLKNTDQKDNMSKTVLCLCGVICLLVFLSLLSSSWFAKQAIKNIKVSGNTVLTLGEINTLIDEQIMNIPNEGINLTEIKNKLITHEYIADAFVWFNSKGVLGIDIKERVPVAIVVSYNGEIQFVDQDGAVFQYRFYKEYTDLPIISNVYDGKTKKIDKVALFGALEIINGIQNSSNSVDKIISEIKYSPKNKDYTIFLTEMRLKILFGRAENVIEKLNKINDFWKENVLSEAAKNNKRNFDVRWANTLIVKS